METKPLVQKMLKALFLSGGRYLSSCSIFANKKPIRAPMPIAFHGFSTV